MYSQARIARQATLGKAKIRCLLAHDHILLRQGLRRLLEDEPDMEVIADAGNVAEALRLALEHLPEVVVTDASFFGFAADQVEQLILRASPHSKVLFLAMHEDVDPLREARSDATNSARRPTSADELVEMIRHGRSRDTAALREMPREGPPAGMEEQSAAKPLRKALTAREQQVLELLAEGKTVRSAAAILGLSVKTVDAHKFNLMRKLGVHNKAELVRWAIQKKIVKLPASF